VPSVLWGEVMRQVRVLPAAVVAIALLATPVQALARHRPAHRHRHHVAHARSQTPRISRAGSAIIALSSARQIAQAASDATVTIADFDFTPASITIHVGDTVTWTNHGPSAHTATANDGSFNTGVLQKGQSASHTFTTAGTFTYICEIHPFMHGTVVVLANTTSTSTTPATTPTTTTPTTTAPTTTAPTTTAPASTTPATTTTSPANTLPMTGFAVTGTVLAGFLLTGVGFAIRKKLRA
jgi:plastocyanin